MEAQGYRTSSLLQPGSTGFLILPALTRFGRPRVRRVTRAYFEALLAVNTDRVHQVNPDHIEQLDLLFPEAAARRARILEALHAAVALAGDNPQYFWTPNTAAAVTAAMEVQP